MKIVLFDLGSTLESDVRGVLMLGALSVLETLSNMTDGAGQPIVMALCSDFTMPASPAQIPGIQQEYYAILDQLDIRRFFEPVDTRVTLSTEVGESKSHRKVFRTALDKIDPAASFSDALFVTENLSHIQAARSLGMKAIHFKGQPVEEVEHLSELILLVRPWSISQ